MISFFIISIVFKVLSCLLAPILFFWKCLTARLFKNHKYKYKQETRVRRGFRICVITSIVVISFSLIALLVAWFLAMNKTLKDSRYVTCAVARYFSDIINGYVSQDDEIKYPGLDGTKWFINKFQSEAFGIAGQGSGFSDLDGLDFGTYSDGVADSITNFYKSYKDKTVSSCQLGGESGRLSTPSGSFGANPAQVVPGVVSGLTDGINVSIEKEASILELSALDLDKIIEVLKTVQSEKNNNSTKIEKKLKTKDKNQQKLMIEERLLANDPSTNPSNNSNSSSQINHLLNQFQSELDAWKTNFLSSRTWTFNFFPYDEYYVKLKTILFATSITMIALVATNLFIIYLTIYMKKCSLFSCMAKTLIPLECCCGGIISILYIYFMLMSILATNGCYFYEKALNDRSVMKKITKNEIYQIADSCIYPNSSGVILSMVTSQETRDLYFKFFQSISGLPLMMEPQIVLNRTRQLKALDYYNQQTLVGLQSFEVVDQLPGSASFTQNLEKYNSEVKKAVPQDFYSLNKTACLATQAISSASDGIKSHLGEPYCIVLPSYPFKSVEARYPGDSQIASDYATLKQCTSSYESLISSMRASLVSKTGPITKKQEFFSRLKASTPKLQKYNQGLSDTKGFLADLGYNLTNTINCRILRHELQMFGSAICQNKIGFGTSMLLQTKILFYMGIIMSLLGCCQFFQIRVVNVYKPKSITYMSISDRVTSEHFYKDDSFNEDEEDEDEEEESSGGDYSSQGGPSSSMLSGNQSRSFIFDNELSFNRLKLDDGVRSELSGSDGKSSSTTANE